ncbi:EamA family transporter [Hydrogenophaga sp. A37]
MTSLAQIILKFGMSSPEVARTLSGGIRLSGAVSVLLHPLVISGLVLYFVAALVWLLVLSKVDVSLAYPFVGLGLVVTMALAWAFLGEAVTTVRIVGTLLIAAGVALLAVH